MNLRAILLAAVVLVSAFVAGVGLSAGHEQPIAEQPTLEGEDKSVTVGESTSVNLTLTEVPDGLQMFNVTVSLSNGAVADVGVVDPVDIDDPGFEIRERTDDSVTFRAADLLTEVESGDESVVIARIWFIGHEPGTSGIEVSVDTMTDDNGNAFTPTVESGNLTVTSAATR